MDHLAITSTLALASASTNIPSSLQRGRYCHRVGMPGTRHPLLQKPWTVKKHSKEKNSYLTWYLLFSLRWWDMVQGWFKVVLKCTHIWAKTKNCLIIITSIMLDSYSPNPPSLAQCGKCCCRVGIPRTKHLSFICFVLSEDWNTTER